MQQKNETEIHRLQKELAEFKKEKEEIKNIIGAIGGAKTQKYDHLVNILFIFVISSLFIMDFARHILKMEIPIPPMLSIEMGVLIVSVKIIWMMHKQMKVEHFQFWILSSIEYRVNDIAHKVMNIEKKVTEQSTKQEND